MSNDRELLEQAEEALQTALDGMGGSYGIWSEKCKPALAAIREALAEQPLLEPEGRCKECMAYNDHLDYCSKAEPVKQEPVAWLNPHNQAVIDARKKKQIGEGKGYPNFSIPLCAAPVERQWVDLTDDEIWNCDVNTTNARRVIAAFKEKNK